MTTVEDLSDAHVLLLATNYATEGQIDILRRLVIQRPDVLRPDIIYRILLTYCAQDASTQELILLLDTLQNGSSDTESAGIQIDLSPVQTLDSRTARKRVQGLNLRPLPELSDKSENDALLRFLKARAHQIDSTGDDLAPLAPLVVPFIKGSPPIRDWFVSRLLPLLRLKYEHYPGIDVAITLQDLETFDGRAGVTALLQYAEKESTKANIGKDLRGVVGPWIHGENGAKRRKLNATAAHGEDSKGAADWQDVNEWVLTTSLNDLPLGEKAMSEWGGPQDIDLGGYQFPEVEVSDEQRLRYSQVGLAIIYASADSTPETLALLRRILKRASSLAGLLPPEEEPQYPSITTQSSKAALFQNALLKPDNELTRPSTDSIAILHGLIESADNLSRLKSSLTVRKAAELCFFGTEEEQRQELQRVLQHVIQSKASQSNWNLIRDQVLWLRSWGHVGQPDRIGGEGPGLLWRLTSLNVESELLTAMLSASQYDTAVRIYAKEGGPLPIQEVEICVQAAIFNAYDNASNGNRTRGGMSRAYEILKAFQPHFLQSPTFREIDKLIAATHALSFYQLTLHYGVPFKPVSIRIHKDPISLIEKILEQNQKAYTKLDDLLGIGRNLVEAGLPAPENRIAENQSLESKVFDAEHRITYLAITSALASNDFDTAYSYITTRLSQSPSSSTSQFLDDTSWRAAYAAGRYRPPATPPSLQSQIASLSRRMELLSLALSLTPTPDPLPEILATWSACEDELESLKMREAVQNRSFDQKAGTLVSLAGHSVVPGGFGASDEMDREDDIAETARMAGRRGAQGQKSWASQRSIGMSQGGNGVYEDEAPIGLFDMMRGAGSALQRSARELRDGSQGQVQRSSMEGAPASPIAGMEEMSGSQRIRKRDQLSGMVTGGLVSGLGWVLGAQPVNKQSNDADYGSDD